MVKFKTVSINIGLLGFIYEFEGEGKVLEKKEEVSGK